MPLYFTKPRRWPPSRPIQFALAVLALLLTMSLLALWLFMGYRSNKEPSQSDDSTASSAPTESLADSSSLLLIINEKEHEQFVLVHAAPAKGRMTVVPFPADTEMKNGSTLTEIFRKSGAGQAQQAVAELLELPVRHYLSLSATQALGYFEQLEEGLPFTVPEDIVYTDKNGTRTHLTAGEKDLTSGQMAALLQYTEWQSPENALHVTADLTAALLNRYLTPERSMSGHFAAIANVAHTDLRIDHFNAYRATLAHFAAQNQGDMCRRIILAGTTVGGQFVPDVSAFRANSGLYEG